MKAYTVLAMALSLAGETIAQTPSGFSPSTNVTLPASFGNTKITPGKPIPLAATQTPPNIDLGGYSTNGSHLIMMLDLDAPDAVNNSYSPALHWLLPVPLGKDESTSTAVAPYIGPEPGAGTGPHRYVLLLFTDPSSTFTLPPSFANLTFNSSVTPDRLVFGVEKFVREGNFTIEAANYFTTKNTTNTVPVVSGALCSAHVSVMSALSASAVLSILTLLI